jgi:hypothetical protein
MLVVAAAADAAIVESSPEKVPTEADSTIAASAAAATTNITPTEKDEFDYHQNSNPVGTNAGASSTTYRKRFDPSGDQGSGSSSSSSSTAYYSF